MYGPPKVGKTSMWMFGPDTGYLSDGTESVEQLVRFGQCPKPAWDHDCKSFEEILDVLADVADHKFGIRNLVVDSATGMEQLCFKYHCREYFEDDWTAQGFYSFYKGPKNAAKKDWPRLLDALTQVKKSNIAVVLLAHSQIKNDPNPFGDEFAKFVPYLDAEVWAQTHRWAEAILFYNIFVDVEKKKGAIKAKAKVGSEERHIYTQPEGVFAAGNRWGLSPLIEAGGSPKEAYQAFVKDYLRAARQGS